MFELTKVNKLSVYEKYQEPIRVLDFYQRPEVIIPSFCWARRQDGHLQGSVQGSLTWQILNKCVSPLHDGKNK